MLTVTRYRNVTETLHPKKAVNVIPKAVNDVHSTPATFAPLQILPAADFADGKKWHQQRHEVSTYGGGGFLEP
ncbi:hypothetical protein [Nitrosospira multiformis]|uniref:hypothetical protein n=1 Tax=Nitrosospira multiformis TaxID=1231 RepID=UPI0009420133|nr:hypothetical protein [Nitrosospira multiformis]